MGGALTLTTIGLTGLAGCNEYEFYNQKQTDIFQQNHRNVVDILLVVDNSCSMIEEQEKLAGNFNSFIQAFQGVDVDYQIGVVTTDTVQEEFRGRLVGGDDEIIFENASGFQLDRVKYDWDWEIPVGASLALDVNRYSASENDSASNWCASTAAFGDGDLGTPGATNGACEASGPPQFVDSGMDTGNSQDTSTVGVAPGPGDVLITEIMVNPQAVDDILGEWVELTNTSGEDLNLSGCKLRDDGRNEWTFPDGASLASGGVVVIGRSADNGLNGGAAVDFATEGGLTLNNKVRIIRSDTEAPGEIFSEMVAVGITGSGIEMGLEAARMALSEPLLSTINAGFLREEANLAFIFVSDEDDSSPYAADDYLKFFTRLKGEEAFRDHSLMNISAVVGSKEPEFPGQPSCYSDHGAASFGHRYVHLASKTEGQLESICEEDFSQLAGELGLLLSGLSLEFELSERPDENSIEVALYETADTRSLVGTLTKDVDYVYVSERNAIRFQEDQIPLPQYFVEVRYNVLATGASAIDDTNGEGTEEEVSP
jgi:hypothetical protein